MVATITSKCFLHSNVKGQETSNKIFRMVLKDLFDKCLNSRIFNLGVTLLKQLVKSIGREKMSRNLAVFDFDHTIINDNSDTAIMKLVDNKIPKEVKILHRSDGWTAFMQGVFKTLHESNIQENAINNLIRNLPAVQGMPDLIKEMNENLNFDVIIISDSNNHFIDLWLEENNLKGNILKVFSNPAKFENGLLKIRMYHLQDNCKLSTKNLCKGQIMEDFITDQRQSDIIYETVVYIGDGVNDFCPILRLRDNDVACVRNKYKCVDLVKKAIDGKYVDDDGISRIVKSNVCIWENGYDIIEFIKQQNGQCKRVQAQ